MSAGAPPPNGPPPEDQPTVYQETVVDSPAYVVEEPAYVVEEPPIEPPIEPGPPLLPPEEPPPNRELWPWLVLLMVLVAAGLLAAYLLSRPDHKKSNSTTQVTTAITSQPTGTVSTNTTPVAGGVIVPSVVGMKQAEAQARLTSLGFKTQVRKQQSTRPAGSVSAQSPAAGGKLKRGSLVGLTVSSGPPGASVPSVVGLTAAEAAAKLQAAGLQTKETKADSLKPAGTVVSQAPPAGSNLTKGGTVVLTVSNGPPDVTVPDVVGMKRKQAEKTLKDLGFTVKFHAVPSQQPPGVVVAQHPAANQTAPKGSRVRLNIAKSPTGGGGGGGGGTSPTPTTTTPATTPTTTTSGKVEVPDVTGEDEQQATSDLENAGFQVQTVDQPVTDQTQDGIVQDQRPAGGTRASSGATVTITVGRFSG